ncbi:MAG: hypothetical protein MK052_06185 [Alphaproteobacteria bacterium]|nr:hypothetical protein [Alphaproteobacteria bacterium]
MPNDNKPFMTRKAEEIAAELGIMGSGHNDELDAFRHAYWSAAITYASNRGIALGLGERNELKGDLINNQPVREKIADRINNEVGREIGLSANSLKEIPQLIKQALNQGKLVIAPNNDERVTNILIDDLVDRPIGEPLNDDRYQLPDPNIPGGVVPEKLLDGQSDDVVSNTSGGSNLLNLFSTFFSSRIPTESFVSVTPNHTRTSNLNLESLLGAEISRSADSIVDRIIGRNPNMFQASAGRFLSQSVERFGEALTKGRIDSIEDAFTSVLGGKNGAIGFASNIGNQVVGGLLQSGLDKLFGGTKTSTTSYESARSIAAGNAFGMSRGQQAAEMLMQLQKGQRNL